MGRQYTCEELAYCNATAHRTRDPALCVLCTHHGPRSVPCGADSRLPTCDLRLRPAKRGAVVRSTRACRRAPRGRGISSVTRHAAPRAGRLATTMPRQRKAPAKPKLSLTKFRAELVGKMMSSDLREARDRSRTSSARSASGAVDGLSRTSRQKQLSRRSVRAAAHDSCCLGPGSPPRAPRATPVAARGARARPPSRRPAAGTRRSPLVGRRQVRRSVFLGGSGGGAPKAPLPLLLLTLLVLGLRGTAGVFSAEDHDLDIDYSVSARIHGCARYTDAVR
jgi:hypothetical protein